MDDITDVLKVGGDENCGVLTKRTKRHSTEICLEIQTKEKEGIPFYLTLPHYTHSIHACRFSFVDPVQGSSFAEREIEREVLWMSFS